MAVKDYVLESLVYKPCPDHPDDYCFDYVAFGLLGELCVELIEALKGQSHRHARAIITILPEFLRDTLPIYPYPVREYIAAELGFDPGNYPVGALREDYDINDELEPAPAGATAQPAFMSMFTGLSNDILRDPEQDTYFPPQYLAPLKLVNDYLTAGLGPLAEPGEGFDAYEQDD